MNKKTLINCLINEIYKTEQQTKDNYYKGQTKAYIKIIALLNNKSEYETQLTIKEVCSAIDLIKAQNKQLQKEFNNNYYLYLTFYNKGIKKLYKQYDKETERTTKKFAALNGLQTIDAYNTLLNHYNKTKKGGTTDH